MLVITRRHAVATLTCAAMILGSRARSFGAVPTQMNVQGRLTDAGGLPLPPGSKTFVFRIFNASSGGAEIWPGGGGEMQNITTGPDGSWSGMIGSVTPLTDGVFAETVRWLEITVSGTTLPRLQLVTGPYAHRVATVDGASGGTITSKLTIGPGHTATGVQTFVAGQENQAIANYSAIGGGYLNHAAGDYAVIGGGYANSANGAASTTAGGVLDTAGGNWSSVGGGYHNLATFAYSTVAGGSGNQAIADYATVGGGQDNWAGYGGVSERKWSTVAGGHSNYANGIAATCGGGVGNSVDGDWSVIGGGSGNYTYTSDYATVGGGQQNEANGDWSTVPGGYDCRASGNYSFAAGYKARAPYPGRFVWADHSNSSTFPNPLDPSIGPGEDFFCCRTTGGALFCSAVNGSGYLTNSVYLAGGDGAWQQYCDKDSKHLHEPVDGQGLLAKIADMPITEWSYKTQDDSIRHIGPTAQDFYAAFGLGVSEKSISTIDESGVALVAIQELHRQNRELKAANADLERRLSALESLVRTNIPSDR